MESTHQPESGAEAELAKIDGNLPVIRSLVEMYHPKLPKGKPFVIVREGERITVELKPRGGREAVLVTIEQIKETA